MSPTTETTADDAVRVDPMAAKAVTRLMSADGEAAMEQFGDPELLAQGKVNIIALDAVYDRFGSKWGLRRDQVYAHAERTLQRMLGARGFYLRVSETDFLICQPELSRFGCQAACLVALREILGHFLGEAHLANGYVHEVNKISSTGVEAIKINPALAARAAAEEAQAETAVPPEPASFVEAPEPEPKPQPVLRRIRRTMDQWSPFVASDGRELRVSCTLEPVFELKNYARIGFRLARRVLVTGSDEELPPAAIALLSRADLLRIDLATIARGLDRLDADDGAKLQPSLIIPVSYVSLSSQRGRDEIAKAFKEANDFVQRGVICEICDLEGVPQVALLSAVSLIRPFSLFVVGRLSTTPPAPGALSQLKGCGLQALSVECPPHMGEAEFHGWSKATIDALKHVTRSVLVYRTASARDAGMVALLGATHASVRAA
ncbi:hypothetical protein [Phenylobacterium sp.]|uniref:hypothetical protein n=1 Tax=Phenylobacterium sp. TaxID=1871053 RepID=UPI0027328831|nr:hypothetical protein [Phenylobacterium sp.]MDP3660160.1 hypothetical protein [Phenylobacterium sp.]